VFFLFRSSKKQLGWEAKTKFKDLVKIMVDSDLELIKKKKCILVEYKNYMERISLMKSTFYKEEDTKIAVIQPFINKVLGYNTANLNEVKSEVNTDYGSFKIDYAIFKDGAPIILIECKKCADILDKKYLNQLKTYYPGIKGAKSKFGILTNGIQYQFYTDIQDENILDSKPFFEFNLLNINDSDIKILSYFNKSEDINNARQIAEELKKRKDLRNKIEELLPEQRGTYSPLKFILLLMSHF